MLIDQRSTMRKILEDILKMPYFKNYAACSGKVHNVAKHEDAVEDIFLSHGLNHLQKGGIKQQQRDAWLKGADHSDVPNDTFMSQPCGTHNSPDFIVKTNNKLFFLECKSASKGTTAPMYNSGIPKEEYIYVFCAEKYNKTTIFMGRDVLPSKEEQLIQRHIAEARKRDEILNALLENNHHGISYYTRPMICHKGGHGKTNYFTHNKRQPLERSVLEGV
jgi:hypothetical protein